MKILVFEAEVSNAEAFLMIKIASLDCFKNGTEGAKPRPEQSSGKNKDQGIKTKDIFSKPF